MGEPLSKPPRSALTIRHMIAAVGLLLFVVLTILIRRGALQRPGFIIGAFAFGYGIARTIGEFYREPDVQLGFLWGGVTMGMLLSLPLILAGLVLMLITTRRKAAEQP